MRMLALFAALALVAAPIAFTPSIAHADGIERPRQPRPALPRPRPAPELVAPAPAPVVETGPETVTLSNSFFAGGGGVGADIGGGYYSSTTVVIRGGSAHASASFNYPQILSLQFPLRVQYR
ncbi:MAG: hypothetical protein DCF16_17585 [Alphaproteobacteria bacterium]|nr:MAG: hypothetical protein DCF16_17585 [Alphaproteobacteria bacterium]